MLYNRLSKANVSLADELHQNTGFKFYTFSNLILHNRIKDKSGLNFTRAHFYLSSPDPEFIRSFSEGLLLEPEFFLGKGDKKADFYVEKAEILPEPEFKSRCTFETFSPIYVKTLRRDEQDETTLREVDLYPKDTKFYENLHLNLVSRYKEFYGQEIDRDDFEVIDVKEVKPKRVTIDNSYRRCSHMKFTLEANPELIKFAYDAGLGEKNAMGFGCIDFIEK